MVGSSTDKWRQKVGCTRPTKRNIVLFRGVEDWLALRVSYVSYPRHDGNSGVPIPESRMSLTLIVHLCS